MPLYRAFGLTIASDLPLPELAAGEGAADVRIDLGQGDAPEDLDALGVAYEALSVLTGQSHSNLWLLSEKFPAAAALMEQAKEDVLAFRSFPSEHWRKIWSTNPLERLNKEIKRRTRVVGIFPNDAAIIRLVGALLLEQQEEWQLDGRRVFSELSMAKLDNSGDQLQDQQTAALTAAA